MERIDIDILLNKSACKVIDQKWKEINAEQEAGLNGPDIRPEYVRNLKHQNRLLKTLLTLIGILGLITLIFPEIWNIIIAFAIVIAIVGFIPFTIWLLLFSKHPTGFGIYYDQNK
jgi:hypothetical protein